jgi:hypothetical protein
MTAEDFRSPTFPVVLCRIFSVPGTVLLPAAAYKDVFGAGLPTLIKT